MTILRRLATGALVGVLVALGLAARPVSAPAMDPAVAAKVDAVFADVDTATSPGCALGVVRDGALVYTRGYGQASVELGVPITAHTVFDIGSVSKQFTAFALELLVHEGKVGLDDEVRKYVPELRADHRPITIRHILTHTSGLRDYNTLLVLAGADERDVTTVPQALAIIGRQRGLEFRPGTSWRYSNTGFFLAAVIAERVSGQPLPALAAARMFGPLGMTATRFAGSHAISVPQHAAGYEPAGDRYAIFMSNWQQVGDGGVQTSVVDLAKWVANLDAPAVGNQAIVAEMQTAGALDGGSPIRYGLGQFVGDYRGVHRVYHSGSWAGFRAQLDRYPHARAAVIVLCNRTDGTPGQRAERVADVVLADRLAGPSPHDRAAAQPVTAAGPHPEALAGTYWSDADGLLLRFDAAGGALRMLGDDRPEPLDYVGLNRYAHRDRGSWLEFTRDAQGRRSVHWATPFGPTRHLLGVAPWTPAPEQLATFAGPWWSEELRTSYDFEVANDRLVRVSPIAIAEPLEPVFDGAFTWNGNVVRFGADASTMDLVIGPGTPIRFVRGDTGHSAPARGDDALTSPGAKRLVPGTGAALAQPPAQ